jgi:hypothetical protein
LRRERLKRPRKKRERRRLGTTANARLRRGTETPADVCCWGCIFDQTTSGSQFNWNLVIDEYTRECPAINVNRRIMRRDVVNTLSQLFPPHGVPTHILGDNAT